MADGDLKYPATGLDSFYSVDLANIWYAVTSGGQPVNTVNLSNSKAVNMIMGTYPSGTTCNFDLSPIELQYKVGDKLKVSVTGLVFRTQSPNPLTSPVEDITILNRTSELAAGIGANMLYTTPSSTPDQFKEFNLADNITNSRNFGLSTAAQIGFIDCVSLPNYAADMPFPNSNIRLEVTGGAIMDAAFESYIIVETEKILP